MNNQENPFGKNYWIALTLSLLILVLYPQFLKWLNPEYGQAPEQTQALETPYREPAIETTRTVNNVVEEIKEMVQENNAGLLEEGEDIYFENGNYQIVFSTLGGNINKILYQGGKEDFVFYESKTQGFVETRFSNDAIDLTRVVFKGEKTNTGAKFTYENPGKYTFQKEYVFDFESPVFTLDYAVQNNADRIQHFPVVVDYHLHHLQEESQDSRFVEAVVKLEKIKSVNGGKVAKKGYDVLEPAEWTGLTRKYYAVLARPESKVISQHFSGDGQDEIEASIKLEPLSIGSRATQSKQILFYAGEQDYEPLKKYGFEGLLAKGFLGVIKTWLMISLKFFYRYTHNYGWAIILLTIVIKLAFTPLTHMSFVNMQKMQQLQPKLKAIQDQFKNDAQKLNQEMMQLYRKNKVNPMMGCLPMLLQIPIFIAFYQALSNAIELQGAPFIFWVNDLSQPDRLMTLPWSIPVLGNGLNILPLFMIGSMVLQQKFTPTASANPDQAKMMQWMPIIFGVMFYAMPSGLVLYWFMNNMLSIFHQVFIKKKAVNATEDDE